MKTCKETIPDDPENPYQTPMVPAQGFGDPGFNSRGWRLAIFIGSSVLIPIYLVVLIASIGELAEVNDLRSREAIDYWRHLIASLVFLVTCGAMLFFSGRQNHLAKYCFLVSPLLLFILLYPGLNVVWNAITGLLR